jgi:hypothetical protein
MIELSQVDLSFASGQTMTTNRRSRERGMAVLTTFISPSLRGFTCFSVHSILRINPFSSSSSWSREITDLLKTTHPEICKGADQQVSCTDICSDIMDIDSRTTSTSYEIPVWRTIYRVSERYTGGRPTMPGSEKKYLYIVLIPGISYDISVTWTIYRYFVEKRGNGHAKWGFQFNSLNEPAWDDQDISSDSIDHCSQKQMEIASDLLIY